MFDYDDDLPEIRTSLFEELKMNRGMVRSLLTESLKVGVAVGVASIFIASTVDRVRSIN